MAKNQIARFQLRRPFVFTTAFLVIAHHANAGFETEAGSVLLHGTAIMEYDSNISANHDQVGDTIFSFAPELGFVRRKGVIGFESALGVKLEKFLDHGSLDGLNPYANAKAVLKPEESGKSQGQLSLSYARVSTANPVVNARTESNDLLIDGDFTHEVTEKFGYLVRGGVEEHHYLTRGFGDTTSWSLGSGSTYTYSPKLLSFAAYRFRRSSGGQSSGVTGEIQTKDHLFTLGAKGELAPKISGNLETGLILRSFDHGGLPSAAGFFVDGKLTWAASENLSTFLSLSRDFDVTPYGQSVETQAVAMGTATQINEKLSIEAQIQLGASDYLEIAPRKDRVMGIQGGMTYQFTDRFEARFHIAFQNADSDVVYSDYHRVAIGLSGFARF